MYKRREVIDKLKPFLVNQTKILSIWEGGSAATNALDEFSDLDLLLVAEKEDIEVLFQIIDAFFEAQFGIIESMRMHEPTWHGFAQKFYLLNHTEPWFYVDLCILPKTIEDRFTAVDRHGNAVVWKDSIGFVHSEKTACDVIDNRVRVFYKRAIEGAFVLRLEVKKALHRNCYLDAYQFLYGFVMRHLVILMNIEHRKEKVDFGIRYAQRDYSKEDYELLMQFLKASTIEDIGIVSKALFKRFDVLKDKYATLNI